MSEVTNISLYENENKALDRIKSGNNRTFSDIIRIALEKAKNNPSLLQRYLDCRASENLEFNPNVDGFDSPKFIYTLFDINTGKTYFKIYINAGMLNIYIPMHTDVEFDSKHSVLNIRRNNITAKIQTNKIDTVQLYDAVTGDICTYRPFSREKWPKNIGLVLHMRQEE